MAELDALRVMAVTERLTVPTERWGWEFHEPVGVQPCPAARPQWSEPAGPHLPTLDAKYAQARAAMGKRIVIVAVVLVIGLCLTKYGIILDLVAIGLGVLWFLPLITSKQRADQLMNDHQRYRQQAWDQHCAAEARWQADDTQWRRTEEQRVASADHWFPIAPNAAPSRIDVFGGTAEGRASFLVTLGAGLLAMRAGMTVLDLSERDVAGPLEQLARVVEFPYQRISLPADLNSAGLLDGIRAEDVAELIAWALHTRRGANEGRALLDLDADILKNVATRLDGDLTIGRLAAGLRIVQRVSDGREVLLGAREQQRLSQYVDVIGTSERMLGQVQDLRSTLESLGGPAPATGSGAPAGRPGGLTVFASEDHNNRRRDLLNRLVAQTVIHRLRQRERPGDIIVIAGADTLGIEALNQLHQAAQRAGVRLVFLLEHLSEEFEPYLGDAESASIFMRMQNTREAARAAEHIGRGHSFTLTQITDTTGTSDSFTRSSNQSSTYGSSESRNHGAGGSSTSRSTNESVTDGTGTSSTYGTNDSTGRTESRVYEFTVEPTHFQGLDPRSYVLVEPVPGGGRRILAGTCDPGVLALPGVSDVPLSDAARAVPQVPRQAAGPGERRVLPVTEVNIADPSGQYRAFADNLTRAGYVVQYQRDARSPILSGWLITGHRDGRPLDPDEIARYR